MSDETKYRIWVMKRNALGSMEYITDEDIWVGNVPDDGKSKHTEGYTKGPDFAYVDFTWSELIQAMGGTEPVEPTVEITSDYAEIPETGETITYTIRIQNGTYYDSRVPDYGTIVNVDTSVPSSVKVKVRYPANPYGSVKIARFIADVKGIELLSSEIFSTTKDLDYKSGISTSNADYIIFTCKWENENSSYMSHFTYLDKLATGSTGWCSEYFEKGVGRGNGIEHDELEMYVGESYENAILKFAGESVYSEGEYTAIDLKKLNQKIEEGINIGRMNLGDKVIFYIMGSRDNNIGDTGPVGVLATAYTGGDVFRIPNPDRYDSYKYEVTGYTSTKVTNTPIGINVFSKEGVILNEKVAIEAYSTIAAVVYDYESRTCVFVYDENKVKTLDSGYRYRYGLQSPRYDGKFIYVDETTYDELTDFEPQHEFSNTYWNDVQQREYSIAIDASFVTITGSTPSTENYTVLVFDDFHTYPATSEWYDGNIQITKKNNAAYEVLFPANTRYRRWEEKGFRIYCTLSQSQARANYYYRLFYKSRGRNSTFEDYIYQSIKEYFFTS